MKTRLVLFFVILLCSASLFAQETSRNSLWTVRLGDDEYRLGGFVGTNLKYSRLEDDPAGYLDLKAGITINSKWAVGLSATGLYYDKKLKKIVQDGTYHLYAGYAGLFVERMFSFTDDLKFSASVFTGQGEVYYMYDKEYRENRPWYQETIDRESIYVFEPGLELQHRISGNFFLGLSGSYRMTSPLNLVNTSDDVLRTFSAGISVKYGVF